MARNSSVSDRNRHTIQWIGSEAKRLQSGISDKILRTSREEIKREIVFLEIHKNIYLKGNARRKRCQTILL